MPVFVNEQRYLPEFVRLDEARIARGFGVEQVKRRPAREGRATRADFSGSTITIASLGALGGVASTPIINYPEVAVVGVNRIAERPMVRGAAVAIRKMMNLS